MPSDSITHVYYAKNRLHIREMVPANQLVFKDFNNLVVTVCPEAPVFQPKMLEDIQGAPAASYRWWRVLLIIASRRRQILIYHGGYWAKIWWVIFFSSLICRRQIFVNWGGELVAPTSRGGRQSIRHIVRRIAVRRLFAVVFLSESDAELGIKAHPKIRQHSVIPYFNERHSRRVKRQQAGKIRGRERAPHATFQVGNDASEANDHLACLEQFRFVDVEKTFVFPMNYGRNDEEYISSVLFLANSMERTNYEVLEELLSPDSFDEIIDRCDALLIGSENQRSLYSIYAYLGSGKPVFLPRHSKARRDLVEMGFEIDALESISAMTPEMLLINLNSINQKNVLRVQEILGLDTIRSKWDILLQRASAKGTEAD